MRPLFILLLITVVFTACKHPDVWTKPYEQHVYNSIDSGSRKALKDSNKRKSYCIYMVRHLKETLPLGLASIQGDSLKRLSAKFSAAYEASHIKQYSKTMIPWTANTIAEMKGLMENNIGNKYSQQAKDKYCNCVIAQLKMLYPDSLASPISQNTTIAINTPCIAALEKN